MTQVAVSRKQALDLPLDLEGTPDLRVSVTARWQDDEGKRELLLALNSAGELRSLEELLRFCYDAGFADASNPRLFVP
jgi:hypothetical protein